jgi:hypothetical protein
LSTQSNQYHFPFSASLSSFSLLSD